MGHLTEDMHRLRAEIAAMKRSRQSFMSDLAQDINALKQEVGRMQAGFRDSRISMAKAGFKTRKSFVANVKRQVAALKRQVAEDMKPVIEDLAGAGRAWRG